MCAKISTTDRHLHAPVLDQPFLVFVPGWPRLVAAAGLFSLQIGIQLHGNFGWFNILTTTLCIPLLDPALDSPLGPATAGAVPGGSAGLIAVWALAALQLVGGLLHLPFASGLTSSWPFLPVFASWAAPSRRAIIAAFRLLQPWRVVHGYGVRHTRTHMRTVSR